MKAADLPFLYPGYLLHQASPGCKPGISEHAPVMLFMPIYFVLGQHDVQSPSRHDNEALRDLLRAAGTSTSKWDIVRNFVLLGLFGFEMFEILWVLELLTGAPYWDSV
jgi:hypothetical protein